MFDDLRTWEEAVRIVADEVAELCIMKQKDYGHGNILAFGEYGVLVRTSDKLERLKNLLKLDHPLEPENEAIEDTWMDLAGYSLIALMLRRGIFTLPLEGAK